MGAARRWCVGYHRREAAQAARCPAVWPTAELHSAPHHHERQTGAYHPQSAALLHLQSGNILFPVPSLIDAWSLTEGLRVRRVELPVMA